LVLNTLAPFFSLGPAILKYVFVVYKEFAPKKRTEWSLFLLGFFLSFLGVFRRFRWLLGFGERCDVVAPISHGYTVSRRLVLDRGKVPEHDF
jgi:hypothetical protein